MITTFFDQLSQRLYQENDLSDLTWSLAKACPVFLKVFMDYFDFKADESVPLSIEREYILDINNRPDFCVIAGDKRFVIENKLGDTDYHIAEYSAFRKTQNIVGFALIVNHTIDHAGIELIRKYGWKVSKWEDFTKYLEGKIDGGRFNEEEKSLVGAYIKFVKGVCSIMEIKKMVFDNLIALYYFNQLLGKIVSDFKHKEIVCSIYNGSKPSGDSYSGVYFCIQKKTNHAEAYPWFGIYYGEEPPSIAISFSKSWCPKIYEKYRCGGSGEMFTIIKEDDNNEVSFELKVEYYGEFIRSAVDNQQQILCNFFHAVIEEIKGTL